MHDGIVQEFSVAENLMLDGHMRPPYCNGFFLNFGAIAATTRQLVEEFAIRTPSIDTPTRSLSGGNIQKIILARELARNPRCWWPPNHTRRGHRRHRVHPRTAAGPAPAGHGHAADLRRLGRDLALSDRIAVMYEGRVMDIVPRARRPPNDWGC